MSDLNKAMTSLLENTLDKMLHQTADKIVEGMQWDREAAVKEHLRRETERLFNEDAEIRAKVRTIILSILDAYRVPTPEERKSRS